MPTCTAFSVSRGELDICPTKPQKLVILSRNYHIGKKLTNYKFSAQKPIFQSIIFPWKIFLWRYYNKHSKKVKRRRHVPRATRRRRHSRSRFHFRFRWHFVMIFSTQERLMVGPGEAGETRGVRRIRRIRRWAEERVSELWAAPGGGSELLPSGELRESQVSGC